MAGYLVEWLERILERGGVLVARGGGKVFESIVQAYRW